MEMGKSQVRLDLEARLAEAVVEIKAQMDLLTELRITGMYTHHAKLASSMASLTAALVKSLAELRQQEKHKQQIYDAMNPEELDACLAGHFVDISVERREFFRQALDALESKRGILG